MHRRTRTCSATVILPLSAIPLCAVVDTFQCARASDSLVVERPGGLTEGNLVEGVGGGDRVYNSPG